MPPKGPKVSIVTALYNHERYVAQAIESVRAQTFTDWELLLWDDGSQDRSLELAREYAAKDERIKVFTHPGGANRGQENTRNAALKKAKGQLLGLLDSDDFYHPRKLELLVPCFDNHRVGLAYGRAEFLLEGTAKSVPVPITKEPQGRVFDELVEDNFICAGATLFRRQCVAKGLRFDAAFRTIGEYPLWLKIARDWEIARVPQIVATWRSHGANLGTKLGLQAKAELVTLCERLLGDEAYSEHRLAIARALAKRRYDYASELYAHGQLRKVRALCMKVARETNARPTVRAKSSALVALTYLGAGPNKAVARAKKSFWKLRRQS